MNSRPFKSRLFLLLQKDLLFPSLPFPSLSVLVPSSTPSTPEFPPLPPPPPTLALPPQRCMLTDGPADESGQSV